METFSEHAHVLAALYHESVRTSVAAGDTLAHTAGQAKPFTEFNMLPEDAREGRLMTAANISRRVRIVGFAQVQSLNEPATIAQHDADVDRLAVIIHEAEREAIEANKVVVKLNPPQPWIPFSELPTPAQQGRRRQAAFFLARFSIEEVTAAPTAG